MSTSELHITPFKCPFCVGGLVLDNDGKQIERCLHCSGSGLTDQPCGDAERAPRPPGVMRVPCADCAFRAGSPELEANGVQLPEGEPFFCHQGVPISASGSYTPVAMFRGLPLGLMVCAGWWAQQTGEPLPGKPYREIPVTEDEVEKRWGHPRWWTNPSPRLPKSSTRTRNRRPRRWLRRTSSGARSSETPTHPTCPP